MVKAIYVGSKEKITGAIISSNHLCKGSKTQHLAKILNIDENDILILPSGASVNVIIDEGVIEDVFEDESYDFDDECEKGISNCVFHNCTLIEDEEWE